MRLFSSLFWGFWRALSTERASEKKTFLWVLSKLASISVAAVFSATVSVLKFVTYLPATTVMCASSALYLMQTPPPPCVFERMCVCVCVRERERERERERGQAGSDGSGLFL